MSQKFTHTYKTEYRDRVIAIELPARKTTKKPYIRTKEGDIITVERVDT